ncbi:MAG: antitoxin component YwqK of YwqJK toxin-antitoxin module [Cyclobacteriaceae bacterium]|jgi:antitoxin component YwqK of YwqJK toxin-antitoxin module
MNDVQIKKTDNYRTSILCSTGMALFIVILLLSISISKAQEAFPYNREVEDLQGDIFEITEIIENENKPVLFLVWPYNYCTKCIGLLDTLNRDYKHLSEEYDLRIVVLNISDDHNLQTLTELVKMKQWKFANYVSSSLILSPWEKKFPFLILFEGKKIAYSQTRFIDCIEINSTLQDVFLVLEDLNEKAVYLDKNGRHTNNKETATYLAGITLYNGNFLVKYFFVENSKLAAKGMYKDQSLILEEGDFQSYYKTGEKWINRSYINGKKEGLEIFYHRNGKVWTKREYSNGRLLNILLLQNENGNPLDAGTLKAGNGKLFIYDKTGNKIEERKYVNGYIHGKKSNINLEGPPVNSHTGKDHQNLN